MKKAHVSFSSSRFRRSPLEFILITPANSNQVCREISLLKRLLRSMGTPADPPGLPPNLRACDSHHNPKEGNRSSVARIVCQILRSFGGFVLGCIEADFSDSNRWSSIYVCIRIHMFDRKSSGNLLS